MFNKCAFKLSSQNMVSLCYSIFLKVIFFLFFFCIKTRFIMSFISQGSHDLALSKECVLLRIGTCFSWRENPEL